MHSQAGGYSIYRLSGIHAYLEMSVKCSVKHVNNESKQQPFFPIPNQWLKYSKKCLRLHLLTVVLWCCCNLKNVAQTLFGPRIEEPIGHITFWFPPAGFSFNVVLMIRSDTSPTLTVWGRCPGTKGKNVNCGAKITGKEEWAWRKEGVYRGWKETSLHVPFIYSWLDSTNGGPSFGALPGQPFPLDIPPKIGCW